MSDTKLNVQLEGLFTILVAILFICLFPASSGNPVSLLGIRYFCSSESSVTIRPRRTHGETSAGPRSSLLFVYPVVIPPCSFWAS